MIWERLEQANSVLKDRHINKNCAEGKGRAGGGGIDLYPVLITLSINGRQRQQEEKKHSQKLNEYLIKDVTKKKKEKKKEARKKKIW